MNSILDSMILDDINLNESQKEYKIKEAIQEIVLYILSNTDFFDHAAFYGGTALRLFYGLDRFSEDLDFSLKEKNEKFEIDAYLDILKEKLVSFGLDFSISKKKKNIETNIMSAFLKSNTKNLFLTFYNSDKNISKNAITKIKLEIDTLPPEYASFENKYQLKPIPYELSVYDEASLFAGKIHAILCRLWKNRIKGRDLYDYVFYLKRKSEINMKHLEARLKGSGFLGKNDSFDKDILKDMLFEHFMNIDIDEAKKDISPFINNQEKIRLWSKDFFIDITKNYLK